MAPAPASPDPARIRDQSSVAEMAQNVEFIRSARSSRIIAQACRELRIPWWFSLVYLLFVLDACPTGRSAILAIEGSMAVRTEFQSTKRSNPNRNFDKPKAMVSEFAGVSLAPIAGCEDNVDHLPHRYKVDVVLSPVSRPFQQFPKEILD